MTISREWMRLKTGALIIGLVLTGSLLSIAADRAQTGNKVADARDALVGDWTGESRCQGNRPACHDEQVVYHISKTPGKSDTITLSADKIVDGKAELMGVLDFKYDPEKGTLTSEFTRGNTHGIWEYAVQGDTMIGTLIILPDKTIGRRVKVTKSP